MSGNWTVTIDDTSSFINYQPHGDGGVGDWTSTGWQPWFSDSGGFSQQGGESGSGNSLHITAYAGASLDFQFFGTSIALYGTANCSYDVSVDGASTTLPATNTNGQLYARDGLNEQTHRVTLTAHASNSSMFSFDRADVSRPLPSSNSDTPKPTVISATNTTFIQYQGNWTQKTDSGKQIPSKEHPAPYYEVETAPASLSFSFQGTGIAVNGSRNWGSYTYDVTLNGETTSYNASTMWLIGDSLLFYQDGLNPNTAYNFSLTPRLGSGYKFWINSVTLFSGGIVYDRDGTTDSKKTNVGVIVGPIIGGVAALLILGALSWWWRRRRIARASAVTEAQLSPFVFSAVPHDAVTLENLSTPPQSSKLAREGAALLPSRNTVRPPGDSNPGASAPSSAWGSSSAPLSPPATGGDPSSSAHAASASTTQPASDASDHNEAAVDRLIQLITARVDRSHGAGPRSEYGSDAPPPEYHA